MKGTVTILADWTGAEGKSFQAVLDGFKKKNPDVTVKYKPSTTSRPRSPPPSRVETRRTSPQSRTRD